MIDAAGIVVGGGQRAAAQPMDSSARSRCSLGRNDNEEERFDWNDSDEGRLRSQ